MAKVILERIGSPIESFMDPALFRKNLEHMESLNQRYVTAREEIKNGWGEKYIDRVHQKGKLTTFERIEMLKDAGTEVFPVGTFVNYGKEFVAGRSTRKSPNAGVSTAGGKVEGMDFINHAKCDMK